MKRAKKIWEENKILFILAIILVACLIVLVGVSLKYFYGSSNTVYGNRLDVTEKTPLKDETINKVKSTLEENEKVNSVKIIKKGKIVYISIKYVDDVKMDEAKKIAESSIELFTEEELGVYDIEYTIKSTITKEDKDNKSYTLMGSKNANGSEGISWNNYNIEETEETKK